MQKEKNIIRAIPKSFCWESPSSIFARKGSGVCQIWDKKGGKIPDRNFRGALCNRQAFTLIELLVVVLIIAILAAIALPQYQKAVAKSRLMSIIPIVKSIEKAADVYYLEHGQYVKNNIFAYDFQYPGCKSTQSAWCDTDHNFRFQIENNINIGRCTWDVVGAVTDDEGNAINSYSICLDRDSNRGLIECGARRGNSVAESVCLSLGAERYSGGNCIDIAPKVWCTRYKLN